MDHSRNLADAIIVHASMKRCREKTPVPQCTAPALRHMRQIRSFQSDMDWQTRRVAAVMDYIRENHHQELSVQYLARACGLSPTHFGRSFRDVAGCTPGAFIRRVRIEQAAKLLRDRRLSVKQVAFATGFRSAYHFSRVFRSTCGVSPSEHRNRVT